MNSSLTPLLLLTLCCAASAQQPISVAGTIKKIDPTNREARPPVAAVSEQIQLAQQASDAATVSDAWTGSVELNKKKLAVVIGKSKADAELPDVLWVDLDGNGKLDDVERKPLEVTKRQGRSTAGAAPEVLASKPVDLVFATGGAQLEARLVFMRQGEGKPIASLQFPAYLEGTFKIGDAERVVAVLDKDLDGKYGTAGDLWVLAKQGDRPATPYGMSGFGEHRFDGGKSYGIAVDGTTITITATDAAGPDPKDLAAQRHRAEKTWSDRFDKEREEFVKTRGIDTARPRAQQPIEWRYVTFEQGLAMAKAEQKPLFVDVMAFWCVWCYRMDYYTYVDQQVAELLGGKFVPVKILQEQDAGNDYQKLMEKLGARGIPAMGIFDADGNVVHTIGGWKKPEEFVADLQKGLK